EGKRGLARNRARALRLNQRKHEAGRLRTRRPRERRRQHHDRHCLSHVPLLAFQGTIRNGALSRVARTKAPASVTGTSFTCAHSTPRSCASSVTASAGTAQTKACCFGPDVAPR